jgi:hypothetical protein
MVEDGVRTIRCRHVAELPAVEAAEEIVAMSAAVDGRICVLSAPRAVDTEEAVQGRHAAARVHVHDGDATWWTAKLAGRPVAYPLLELLPGGQILLVGARSRRFRDGTVEDNAHVFGPDGRHLRSFCLGDGIEHLGVDAAGTIWVGYFDEGVFGNLGWDEPIGAAGLVRFDDRGHRLWTYQPVAGTDQIVDCYALNVDARTVYAYYYSDFPLIQITDGRTHAYTPTPVRGARHLLVLRDQVVFVGQYNDPLHLADCRLTGHPSRAGHVGGGVDYLRQAVLHDPDGAPLHLYRPITARGGRLWVHANDRILLADLADDDNR